VRYNLTKFMDKLHETLFYDELYCKLREYVIDWLDRRSEDELLSPQQRAFCKRLLNLLLSGRADVDFDVKLWVVIER